MDSLQKKGPATALIISGVYFLGFSCFLFSQTNLSQQSASSEQRVLRFPGNFSVGTLCIEDAATEYCLQEFQLYHKSPQWKFLSQAQGEVVIAAGYRVQLLVNPECIKTPGQLKALSALKPDDLFSLKCDNWEPAQSLPDECVSCITALTGLRELSLIGYTLSNAAMKQLGKMPSLTILYPPDTTNAGVMEIAQIKTLKTLIFYKTRCTDKAMSLLRDLPQLETLNLSGPNFTDFATRYLPQIPGLSHLSLGSSFSDASLSWLSKCPALKSLQVNSETITDQGVKHISKIRTLEHLNIYPGYGITDAGIASLKDAPNLKGLSVPFAPLTDDSMRLLAEMPGLEHIDVGSEKITDAGIQALCRLTNLKYLTPSHSSNAVLTDASLEAISKLIHLEELNCSGKHFTSQGVEKLASLKKLRRLGMHFGRQDDRCLEVIAGLEHMESLSLSGVTIGGINKLNRLTKLKDVQFRKVKKDSSILNLSNLNQLEYIYLIMETRYDEKTRNQKELFLTDRDIQCFTNKPYLNFFCISGIDLDDESFKIIAAMKSLSNLQISGPTRLTDHAFELLPADSPMMAMRINEGHFTAAGLKHLEKLQNLGILALTSDTPFAPKDVSEFKKNSPVKNLELKP